MHPRPHPHFADMTVSMVACGEGFTVCTVENKLLYAWGANDHGQVRHSTPPLLGGDAEDSARRFGGLFFPFSCANQG
jgi:alpha-tubulin suppressor-like RCC1 family protein